MIERLRLYWNFLRTGLWFLPLLMSIGAVLLAEVLLGWTGPVPSGPGWDWLIFTADGTTARDVLSSLLSGIMTMTSLVVSIMIVVLTLAAGQLGPRLIRNFMGDMVTQVVLGLFVSTILYLLVVFRTLADLPSEDISRPAVTVATVLPILCLFALLIVIHRLARSIMYDNAVQRVTDDLRHNIRYMLEQGEKSRDLPSDIPEDAAWVKIDKSGYIQTIDFKRLIAAASEMDAVIWLKVRAGHYIVPREHYVAVHPPSAVTEKLTKQLGAALIVGGERTPTQDLEYGIRQLVEIALRALSPGINDPFTALVVIDNLTACIGMIYDRALETPVQHDANGMPRVVRTISDYEGVIDAAYDQIRQAGSRMPAVLIHMADSLGRLAPYVRSERQRAPVLAQLEKVWESARSGGYIAQDLDDLRQRYEAAKQHLCRFTAGVNDCNVHPVTS